MPAVPSLAQCPDGTPPPCAGARSARPTAPPPNSVAVLYFDNLSRDTGDAYLADGLTEEIIVRLGQVQRLNVKTRFDVQLVRGRPVADPAALGRTLNATFLVSGSVQRSGPRVRVRVELVRAASRQRVWGDVFARSSDDVLAIEEEVARAIVQGVTGQLLPAERTQIARRPTADPVAYDLYLRGNYLANRFTEPDLRAAIAIYEQAFTRDSTFALAQLGIASAWFFLADDWVAPREAYPRARRAAERALALDSLASAAGYLVLPALTIDYDIARAEAIAERALARDPGAPWVQFSMMFVRFAQGRRSDAVAFARRGWEADTLSFLSALATAVNLGMSGAFDDLAAFLPHARSAAPEGVVLGWEGAVLYGRGECADAAERFRSEQQSALQAFLVPALVCAGQRPRAREALGVELRRRQAGYRSGALIAIAYAALGEVDSAFAWMDRAVDERDTFLLWLRTSPLVEPLRSDPRFEALLRRTWLRRAEP